MDTLQTIAKSKEVDYSSSYSAEYRKIRDAAQTKWPAWKVSAYNSNIAISAHAKKISVN